MNMNAIDIILSAVGGFISLGILAAGFGYAYAQFKRGTNQQQTDAVESETQLTKYWKDQVDGFKVMVTELNRRVEVLSGELNQLKGQLVEKEKQNREYLAILQDRDPQTQTFMSDMTQFVKDQAVFQKDVHQTMVDIHAFMNSILPYFEMVGKDLTIEATVSKK